MFSFLGIHKIESVSVPVYTCILNRYLQIKKIILSILQLIKLIKKLLKMNTSTKQKRKLRSKINYPNLIYSYYSYF